MKQEQRSAEDLAAVARFKTLTEAQLPAQARAHSWPIRFDHCFKRICLDWAFGDVWYHHLPRPAERFLAGEPLRRAVACAEELRRHGLDTLLERDARSLSWRGKRSRQKTQPQPAGLQSSSTSQTSALSLPQGGFAFPAESCDMSEQANMTQGPRRELP